MDYFYTKMCLFNNKNISKKYLHFNNSSTVQLRPIYALCLVHLRFMSDLHNKKIVTIFESQLAKGRCRPLAFSETGQVSHQNKPIMAIVKGPFATNFANKLGKVVFSNRQGVNIARQMPASVKNPQTSGQQKQRMLFTTVQVAYKKLKTIADHSFEGYTYGAKSMARFLQLNLNSIKTMDSYNANFRKNTTAMVPNPFIISRGSLPSAEIAKGFYYDTMSNDVDTEIPKASNPMATMTLANFLSFTNMKIGQQLTFINVSTSGNKLVKSKDIVQPAITMLSIARVVFKTDALTTALVFDGTGHFNPTIVNETDSENWNIVKFKENAESLGWNLTEPHSHTILMAATITSEKQGTTWLRSSEEMVSIAEGDTQVPSTWKYKNDVVINTYDPASPYYLNNATV